MNEEQSTQTSTKKIILIAVAVIIVFLLGVGLYYWFSHRGGVDTGGVTSKTSDVTNTGNVAGNRNITGLPTPGNQGGSTTLTPGEEPLFRQLASVQVAGATAVSRDGQDLVRYVARETGYVYEVDPRTGQSTQLTNTTIPRVYEAYWGNSGNTVVLRFLTRDPLTRRDVIKTFLADLHLPGGSTDGPGSLVGDFLPDNISMVSMSPDGTRLFYLLPTADGVTGTIVTLDTKGARLIFQSAFSEWLPQLLNNGKVILTTKPSAQVTGVSYLYDPADRTLSRLIRQKNALTTLGTSNGDRVLFGENSAGNSVLGVYSPGGFETDEGAVVETQYLPLATLPEKCAWAANHVRVYCGGFTGTPRGMIPDAWYQGVLSFDDTFWTIDTTHASLNFLADPKKTALANQSLDVYEPFLGANESYFFFVNKNDSTLWSMRIIKDSFVTSTEAAAPPSTGADSTATGSMQDTASTTSQGAAK